MTAFMALVRTAIRPVALVLFSSHENAATGVEKSHGHRRLMPVEEHTMRSAGTITTAILLAANVFSILGPASTARAITKEDVAINGTYRVTSIGNWAKINDQYNNEPTVVSTWTINSTCTTFQECNGTMRSDQGWSAPIYMLDGTMWYVKHEVPNWERCQDGTAFTGKQTYWFYPADAAGSGEFKIGSPVLAGKDKTVGPSGACGQNQWLTIDLPLRLDKIG
jgi:hypothetical protein